MLSKRVVPGLLLIYFFVVVVAGYNFGHLIGNLSRIIIACFALIPVIFNGERSIIERLFTKSWFRLVFIVQTIAWLVLIWVQYYSVEYSGFDTGIYANGIANFLRTGTYYLSLLHMHALADHFTPSLLLIAPLFKIWNSFLWLPIFKLIAALGVALLLFVLSRRVLGEKSQFVYWVPIVWLFHRYSFPWLYGELQVSTLSLPFIVLAFIFIEQRNYIRSIFPLLFLLGFKEHLALIWVCVGIFIALEQKRTTLGAGFAFFGILFGLLIYFVVMPYFNFGELPLSAGRFGPIESWSVKLGLVGTLLISFGLLPLFAPRVLLAAVPAFTLTLISKHELMLTLSFHYQDLFVVMLSIASIYGLKKIEDRNAWIFGYIKDNQMNVITAVLPILLFAFHGKFPAQAARAQWPTEERLRIVECAENARALLLQSRVGQIRALDTLTPYLFDLPNLNSILDSTSRIFVKGDEAILLAEGVNPFPLDESRVATLMDRVESYPDITTYALGKDTKCLLSFGPKVQVPRI